MTRLPFSVPFFAKSKHSHNDSTFNDSHSNDSISSVSTTSTTVNFERFLPSKSLNLNAPSYLSNSLPACEETLERPTS